MLFLMHFIPHPVRVTLLVSLVLGLSGCIETYKPAKSPRPRTEQLTVKHRSGGTHYRMLVDDGVWYQLMGTDLLVIDARTGRISYRESLATAGTSGPAIDVVRDGDEMLIVLEESGVVRLTLDDPRRPWLEDTRTSASLGIRPRGIVVIDGSRLVYGDGGVVDFDTGHQLVEVDGVVTSVDESSAGLVYCLDRRIHMVADDDFVGSANMLVALRDMPVGDARRHVFVRNELNGSLVGVLGDDLRELDTDVWTIPMPGSTRSVRQHADRLVVTSDLGVRIYRMGAEGLALEEEVDILGAYDAMVLDEDQLVVSGTFGRGTWRLTDGLEAQRRSFSMYHPEPAGLQRAVSDGRNLLADSDRGMWMYRIGQETSAQVSTDVIEFTDPSREAVMLDWTFRIVGDGREIEVETPVGVDRLVAPRDGRFHCVVAADGVIWLGHDRGIIMVRLPAEGLSLPPEWDTMSPEDRLEAGVGPLDGMTKLSVRLDGPVFFLEPLLLGGGIAYVSGGGGFGVVSEEF